MAELFQGIKKIEICAQCTYPIITAYEFEFLKTEAEVQEILAPCTIYLITQRPLIFFQNLQLDDGLLTFEIADRTSSTPLKCSFDPRVNGFATENEDLLVDIQFYKHEADKSSPFNDVAGIKLKHINGDFLFWLTPQKFIHHILTKCLKANIEGDIGKYIDYKIHYIGRAFSQEIWDRLTGHEKMQSILTMEWPLDHSAPMSSFEISLILLKITGYNEIKLFPNFDFALSPGVKPIIYEFDVEESSESFKEFNTPNLNIDAAELTNEVEAMLINQFQPTYNHITFDNYPEITNGTRSAKYTESTLVIESLPAILSTDTFTLNAILPPNIA